MFASNSELRTRVFVSQQPPEAPRSSYRVLNRFGAECIDRWVVKNALRPERQSLAAWHSYAEMIANQVGLGEEVAIEMVMSLTKSGYPEELRCLPAWFDEVPAE